MKNSTKVRDFMKKISAILLTFLLSISELNTAPVYAADDALTAESGETADEQLSAGNEEQEPADEEEQAEKRLIGKYVVVLDSGHDLEHNGAHGNGLKEEKLNLLITKYCKDALEKNENITVYLTHETLACPYPGTLAKECNKLRCEYAASVDADLFISLHINSSDSKSRRGFEIIYPNAHYKPEFNEAGAVLSNCIVEELKKVGLRFREIYTRDSDENKKDDENFFPDGTRADYYNVIRNSKYNDILGIIIEHGYISNWSDVTYYLSTVEDLKKLGEADAQGIINYLLLLEEEQGVVQTDERTEAQSSYKAYLKYQNADATNLDRKPKTVERAKNVFRLIEVQE